MVFRNCFGEPITEVLQYANPAFGQYVDGIARTNWEKSDIVDDNGFDKRYKDPESDMYLAEVSLPKGIILCRYGFEQGYFSTLKGTEYELLGLPWKKESAPYFEYEVIADGITVHLLVTRGLAAPMFDSPGGAIQFLHQHSLRDEVDRYHSLKRINPWEEQEKKK